MMNLRLFSAPLIAAAILLVAGCSSPESYDNDANQAGSTFTGPRYLRGTIGSYGSFINNRPRYVAGYGMVVDLNGTGSNEVPGFMREWLVNEMLRNRVGSFSFGTERFTPERAMADLGSSVVAVEGLIPPGARTGSTFDVLVTMIDQTSTSLEGGRLWWPTQMSATGLDRRLIYTAPQATGYGKLFVNPIKPDEEQNTEFLRQAVVVNGGTVIEPQKVQFVLNQPSYRIAALIADRINARFEAADDDNYKTAIAKNDGLIEINVPARFENEPEELLELVEHLYLNPTPQFVRPQAQALAQALVQDPEGRADAVVLAWKGLGPNTVPIIRPLYDNENPLVRDAALEAGSWLNDSQAVKPLREIAKRGTPAQRVRAARSLVVMTRNFDARQQVRAMLDDPDPDVRLGAYEALSLVRDSSIERVSVTDGKGIHKFYIDRVPSDQRAIYALQGDELSIAIFGGDVPFRDDVYAKIDDTLTVRSLPTDSIPVGLSGRYEGETAYIPIHRCGALKMIPSLTPVSEKPDAKLPPPDWSVEVGDAEGNEMIVNIRDQKLQDAFGVEILKAPNRATATQEPRLIGLVRIADLPGKDEDGNPTPAVGELLALRSPEIPMPLAVRYHKPGEKQPTVYRIDPTAATIAYTLGYKTDNINTQTGPNLGFTQVVSALNTLCNQGQVPAPFDARINPLAQRIVSAQQDNQAEPRPEITAEELELLRGDEGDDAEAQDAEGADDAGDVPAEQSPGDGDGDDDQPGAGDAAGAVGAGVGLIGGGAKGGSK